MQFGTAPIRPASRFVTPEPASAPCTCRKSTAWASRRAARCCAIASPLACIEMITPRKRKDGTSVQKGIPKSSSKAGISLGSPTHGARSTSPKSYMPSTTAARHPTTIPTTGPHSRSTADPRKMRAATTTRVISATAGPFSGSSLVVSSSRWNTTEARVIDRIIITVPPTVGVITFRRMNSHLEIASWAAAVTTTRVINVPGPPSATAVMQKGMAKAAVYIGSSAPDPTGPIRFTWIKVETPTTTSEANTIQVR